MTGAHEPTDVLAAEILEAAARPWSARTLLLAIDGVLAPAAPPGQDAAVLPDSRDALVRLVRAGWRVALVSGRSAADVRRLLPLEGVHVFGSHGLEGSWGGKDVSGPSLAVRRRLRVIEEAARRLPWHVTGAQVEIKPAGIAFHDREVADEDLVRWRELVQQLLDESDIEGLELLEQDRMLELRPRGQHKGRVLHRMPRRAGSAAHDPSLVVVGQGRADEDLFDALGSRGLSVCVGSASVPTRAVRRMGDADEVAALLTLLAQGEEARQASPGGPRTL